MIFRVQLQGTKKLESCLKYSKPCVVIFTWNYRFWELMRKKLQKQNQSGEDWETVEIVETKFFRILFPDLK